jgi:predicted dehydrogenase
MANPPRIAVIGAGWAARIAHLPAYAANGITPVAIADLNTDVAADQAKRHKIPSVYTDWREMLEKEKPDAVSVCVPNVHHREPVLGCLQAGAHVLCEAARDERRRGGRDVCSGEERRQVADGCAELALE